MISSSLALAESGICDGCLRTKAVCSPRRAELEEKLHSVLLSVAFFNQQNTEPYYQRGLK